MSLESLVLLLGLVGSVASGAVVLGKALERIKQLEDDNIRNFKQHEDFYKVRDEVIRLEAKSDVETKI